MAVGWSLTSDGFASIFIHPESPMLHIENVGRRGFLKGMLGAGAFVLSVRWAPAEMFGSASGAGASDAMTKGAAAPQCLPGD